jgi:2-polyprenyl-3-methyl-5-hydroxy-6-metoxy-1,4-benzoquinol methylase
VLEHVPNPLQTLNKMLTWVKPGGMVVAQTPNGSRDFRAASPGAFHRLWGRVHPFLLTAEFVKRNFGHLPGYVSSNDRLEELHNWNRRCRSVGALNGSNLCLVLVSQ